MEKKNIFLELLGLMLEFFSNKTPTPLPNPTEPEEPKKVEDKAPETKFILTRKQFLADGIISELTDQSGNVWAETLEHSYDNKPKIPNGTWKCVRGPHRLHNMTEDFITFEITGIEGHSNLLFHWGNYNRDSDGCVLLGQNFASSNGVDMVTNSKTTFAKFMASLDGVNEFYLLVK